MGACYYKECMDLFGEINWAVFICQLDQKRQTLLFLCL